MEVKLNLSWDTYQKNICNGLGLLQQRGEFVDMTIAADGHQVKVHQMVLSLVSPYIKELITSAQCQHPIIFLNQVSYQTLQLILEYVYTGEVLMTRDKLTDFLKAGRALHLKGLEGNNTKSNSGDTLGYFEETREEETAVQETEIRKTEEPIQTGAKRKKVDMSEIDDGSLDDDVDSEDLQMDEDHLEDNDDYETILPDESTLTEAKPNSDPSPNLSMQYTLSCQGSVQLVLNRYIYRMRHSRKNEERMWRCTDYDQKTCRAYAITKDRVVVERGCAHNHPFHDKQILKKIREGNMFTAYNFAESMATISAMKRKSAEKATLEKKQNETVDERTIKTMDLLKQ